MKHIILIIGILIVTSIIFPNCENKENTDKKENTTLIKTSEIPDNKGIQDDELFQSTNLELLQGKWQSIDDPSNYLIFEKDHRKEIAKGMKQWDDEVFTLSDGCMNDTDNNNSNEKEKDKYISCKASDLCWYILELDETTLSLSYVGRGNTLTYKKVKQ
jgi:hypothetical protein